MLRQTMSNYVLYAAAITFTNGLPPLHDADWIGRRLLEQVEVLCYSFNFISGDFVAAMKATGGIPRPG